MKQTLHRFSLSLCALALWAGTAAAQKVGVSSVAFPKAQASTSQPVKFTLHNYNTVAVTSTGKVGIKQGDNVLCEESIDISIPKMGNLEVQLPIRLHTDYGQQYAYTVYVDIDGNTATNSSQDVSFTMPTTIAFPLTWDSSLAGNGVSGYGNYKYYEESDMFVAQGRVSTLATGGVETQPVAFEKGQKVKCAFSHYSDLKHTVYAIADYGEKMDTVFTQVYDASGKMEQQEFSFIADSAAIIRLTGRGTGSFNTYGQLHLGKLSLTEAVPDLAADAITAPAVQAVATTSGGYEVTLKVHNASPFDIANPTFHYQYDTTTADEQYSGTIKAFETLAYTFNTKLKAQTAGTATLKAWVTSDDDQVADNNSVEKQLTVYAPQSFPYSTGFDTGNDLWTTSDGNSDGYTWDFASDSNLGNIAYFPAAAISSDDWLFSPAISMPSGKSRISFYYAGANKSSHTQHLRVLMGTEPDLDKMTEVLFDEPITVGGWLNGYSLINLSQGGTRYFAFQATGRSEQIILDNVKIDRGDDLCIGSVQFQEESGFAKTTSKVSLTFINHGVNSQKNIKLRYWLNTANSPYADGQEPYAEETVTAEVQPGQSYTYTFTKEADISKTDSVYSLVGAIATEVGDDRQNDMIMGTASVENWVMPSAPYEQSFEDMATAQKQWTFQNTGTSKWLVGNNSAGAYEGTKALVHQGKVTDGSEDWAFSEPIELKKGTYDLSFFYRTTKNFKTGTPQQTFRAMLGTAAEAGKMTEELLKEEDFLLPGQWCKKCTRTVTISEDGIYYLGFGNTTPNASGMTFIDNISIQEHSDGQTLPYSTDFSSLLDEAGFYKYYPSSTMVQWKLTDQDDGSKAEVAERTKTFSDLQYSSDGYLVLPKFQVEPGKSIDLTFSYSLVCADTPGLTLDVYDGTDNNPDAFTLRSSQPVQADGAFVTKTVTLPAIEGQESSNYYIAFRTSAPEDGANMKGGYIYTVKVRDIKVEYGTGTGIDNIAAASDNDVTIAGNVVTASSTFSIYDTTGKLVANSVPSNGGAVYNASALSGVYIVKTASGKAVKVAF